MAELDVQPKRSSSWWLWLLIALIALVILIFLFKGCISKTTAVSTTDFTSTTKTVAVTQPDRSKVDFNSAKSFEADVTDPGIEVSGNEQYTIYTLGDNILFASNDATL